jgi:hypothetical protein
MHTSRQRLHLLSCKHQYQLVRLQLPPMRWSVALAVSRCMLLSNHNGSQSCITVCHCCSAPAPLAGDRLSWQTRAELL